MPSWSITNWQLLLPVRKSLHSRVPMPSNGLTPSCLLARQTAPKLLSTLSMTLTASRKPLQRNPMWSSTTIRIQKLLPTTSSAGPSCLRQHCSPLNANFVSVNHTDWHCFCIKVTSFTNALNLLGSMFARMEIVLPCQSINSLNTGPNQKSSRTLPRL